MKKGRRQFLKNTSIAAIAAVVTPKSVMGDTLKPTEKEGSTCNPTTLDFYGQGPFYTPNAPTLVNGQLANANEPGTRLIVSGRILNLDCTELISGAEIDIWHADDAGNYDNQGMNLRGKVLSNSQGFYLFETVFPGKYLNGNAFRPAHIHFKITPPGYPQLTTQLYFQGDTSIPGDAAASITSGTYDATHRIVPTTTNAASQLECTWDIVLDGDGQSIGNEELRSQLGMIYQVSPNPFNDVVKIHYGVFQEARVQLQVFDIQGRLIADLEESSLSPDKFEAEWRPSAYMADGHYFIALKINDFQVHYLKVTKES